MSTYCGLCDSRQTFQAVSDRRLSRALHIMCCMSDTLCETQRVVNEAECSDSEEGQSAGNWKCTVRCRERRVIRRWVSLCGNCAASGICPYCGCDAVQIRERPIDDSDGEDCADVRVHPPRFTPWGRTNARDWLRKGAWFLWGAKKRCSGCEIETSIRSVILVVHIDPAAPRGRNTARYKHLLCGRCTKCVQLRYEAMVAASACHHVFNHGTIPFATALQVESLQRLV